jgi:Cu/Ag efflux pump CusA
MIGALLRFVLSQRLIVVALGIALVGVGLYAFGKLKIEAYPDISDTQAVVISLYPGRAAEEVEQQVTAPIERALNNVPNVIARRSRTLVEGLVIVGVLLFFLGSLRAALLTALTIPLSLLFAFIYMRLAGIPANLLSLGAIDFGIIVCSLLSVLTRAPPRCARPDCHR